MQKTIVSIYLLLFFVLIVYSQTVIQGKVLFEGEGIKDATVYMNGTTFSAFTDENGAFEIEVENGVYQLIVSAFGFETEAVGINTTEYTQPITFNLKEEAQVLDEVTVVSKPKNDGDRQYNFNRFKDALLGKSDFANDCVILNPKTLSFYYSPDYKIFRVRAKSPVQIRNNALGYIIEYDLNEFVIEDNLIQYDGFFYFKPISVRDNKKKWINNRKIAYQGSPVHFFKSLISNNLKENGYRVNRFERILNPNRPTDNDIEKARELIRLSSQPLSFSKKNSHPKNAMDSAMEIIQKVRLPKYMDVMKEPDISEENIITIIDGNYFLQFTGALQINYLNEKPEINYFTQLPKPQKANDKFQTSNLVPYTMPLQIYPEGILANPLKVIFEGYWSYEKMACWLPLNYKPEL